MPVSKHAKAQRRLRGTTYKLVRKPYLELQAAQASGAGEVDGEGDGVVRHEWVREDDLHRAARSSRTRGGGGMGNDMGADLGDDFDLPEGDEAYWAHEHDGDDYHEEDEAGEWVDDDEAFDEMFGGDEEAEEGGPPAEAEVFVRAPPREQERKKVRFTLPQERGAELAAEPAGRPRRVELEDVEESGPHPEGRRGKGVGGVAGRGSRPERESSAAEADDGLLFDDEVECEVTDEFLRQIVFGTGLAEADGEQDDDEGDNAAPPIPSGIDGEVWNLLTEEERAAVMDAQRRGTQRRRRQLGQPLAAGAEGNSGGPDEALHHLMLEDGAGVAYPQHAPEERRALERQFDAMMSEFDSDLKINDFFEHDAEGNSTGVEYRDPRTMGALSINKYLSTLEEFVEDRAGVNLETSEPRKNKGLLTQLKFLARNEGVFDYDERSRGVFLTNNMSDKQRKFAEEFRAETDRIRREARMRVLKRMLEERRRREAGLPPLEGEEDADAADTAAAESREEWEIVEVRSRRKEDRMDCETATSARSSYFNQPNVIRAPPSRKPRGAPKNRRGAEKGSTAPTAESPAALSSSDADDAYDSIGRSHNIEVSFTREKGETSEEKRLRRQAVKQMQRERRQEKSKLKKAYKDIEREEVARAAVSQGAKRTVRFL